MLRKVINIDEEKCTGCGQCVIACHENAIGMVDGKAKLLREDYCDGLGDCLPECPAGAISFVERDAKEYNKNAVAANNAKLQAHDESNCPGHKLHTFKRDANGEAGKETGGSAQTIQSELIQWPCQIKLVPVDAPYFDGAKLLVAADCTAFSFGDFHRRFMHNKITLVGCPKLDDVDYTSKLTQIIRNNNITSVTVARMEVPCCGGLERAVKDALQASGKFLPWQVVTISIDGKVLDE